MTNCQPRCKATADELVPDSVLGVKVERSHTVRARTGHMIAAAGKLTSKNTTGTGGVSWAAYTFTDNHAGHVLSEASTITSDPSNGTTSYSYDKLGRRTRPDQGLDHHLRLAGSAQPQLGPGRCQLRPDHQLRARKPSGLRFRGRHVPTTTGRQSKALR